MFGRHIDDPATAVYDRESRRWRRVTVSLPPEVADQLEDLRRTENGNRSRAISKAVMQRASELGVSDAEAEAFLRKAEFAQYLRHVLATSPDPAARESARHVLKGLGAA